MYRPETVREIVCKSAERFGENCAFTFLDESGKVTQINYKKLKNDVDCLALSFIHKCNLQGEKVGIIAFNCYEWCVAYLACLSAGVIAVPVDRELSGEDIADILDFAQVKAIVCDKNARLKLRENRDTVYIGTENNGEFYSLIEAGERLRKEGYILENEIDASATAVIIFTSGTTGNSKGVMLSNSNLCSDLFLVRENINLSEKDRSLSLLPLHHTYETIAFLMMLYCGGSIAFCKGIRYLGKSFEVFAPTVFVTVPLILEKLHERIITEAENSGRRQRLRFAAVVSSAVSENKKKKLFSQIHAFFGGRLEKIIVGAAPLNSSVAEEFELFGFKVIIGYGLTECSPIIICNSFEDRTSDTVGRPLSEVAVKIRNADEKGRGELLVKGPMVMKGYYKNEGATGAVFADGWFCTGDIGFCDKNGRYRITGRCKSVIVTKNGKNIYPEELEYRLNKSPYISESLVYGEKGDIVSCEVLPDENAVTAKLKKKSVTEEEIKAVINEVIRSVNRLLPSYKRIKKVTVRKEDFSKTSTHKIKRNY